MIPFFPQEEPKPIEEQVRERIADDGKRLKEELRGMTPEERARFWEDIEGTSDDPADSPSPRK